MKRTVFAMLLIVVLAFAGCQSRTKTDAPESTKAPKTTEAVHLTSEVTPTEVPETTDAPEPTATPILTTIPEPTEAPAPEPDYVTKHNLTINTTGQYTCASYLVHGELAEYGITGHPDGETVAATFSGKVDISEALSEDGETKKITAVFRHKPVLADCLYCFGVGGYAGFADRYTGMTYTAYDLDVNETFSIEVNEETHEFTYHINSVIAETENDFFIETHTVTVPAEYDGALFYFATWGEETLQVMDKFLGKTVSIDELPNEKGIIFFTKPEESLEPTVTPEPTGVPKPTETPELTVTL